MANMELIETKTVGSGGAANIQFTSIPQTYTDLLIKISGRANDTGTNLVLTLNSTSTISSIALRGYGSGYTSDTSTTNVLRMVEPSNFTANTFANSEIYIPNYTSSNNKSWSADGVIENNDTDSAQALIAGLTSIAAAITSITLAPNTGSFVQYSTASLYGISNVTSGSKATGGIVSSDGTYWYHMFPYSGTFTPTQSLTADYLVIAGGGGGGANRGAGGGAGGLRSTVSATGGGGSLESALSLTAQAYTVTVGAGGTGGTGNGGRGTSGGDSVFSTITSTGGGAGGGNWVTGLQAGLTGGSGGGAGHPSSGSVTGAAGTANQGYAGGSTSTGNAAGGGGAGAVGSNTAGSNGGAGGAGVAISAFANATQTGVNTYYAAGGGGGSSGGTAGTGGNGGGGKGGDATVAIAGITNTGSGGGGGGETVEYNGKNGGSGLVIIRYAI